MIDERNKNMTYAALFAALIAVMTAWFHLPIGVNGGYVHFGDAFIYLAAVLLPRPYAMAAGAVGGAMADLLVAPIWAPATFFIKPLITLPFSNRGDRMVTGRNTVALAVAFLLSATGYFFAEGLMFGFHTAFFASISGSAVQSGASAVVFLTLGGALDRMKIKERLVQQRRRNV